MKTAAERIKYRRIFTFLHLLLCPWICRVIARRIRQSLSGKHQDQFTFVAPGSLYCRPSTKLSVSEVSQTDDRCRSEEIQPFAMMARVGGFVDWREISEVLWTELQTAWVCNLPAGFEETPIGDRNLSTTDVGGFVN